MVFVAPNPQQNPKYLATIKPMSPLVWLIIFSSLVATAVVFVIISNIETQEITFEYIYVSICLEVFCTIFMIEKNLLSAFLLFKVSRM